MMRSALLVGALSLASGLVPAPAPRCPRLQPLAGVVIKRSGGGVTQTFTVRKMSSGIGVERTFPLYSPTVKGISVIRRGSVRRSKLYYLRGLTGKSARIKEKVRGLNYIMR